MTLLAKSAATRVFSHKQWLCALALSLAAGCGSSEPPVIDADGGGTTSATTTGTTGSGTTGFTPTGTTGTSGTTTGSAGPEFSTTGTGGVDAGTTGTPTMSTATNGGTADMDGGMSDPFEGVFGDGGTLGGEMPSADPELSLGPPANGGAWTLNPDSAAECPPEPPPIPLLGGACLGVYYPCGWTNEADQQYNCICDWVHWLCI